MLTFEKVLTVFADYLHQDPLYEVLLTSHGYTLLAWEPSRNEWYSAEFTATPNILLDRLIDAYANFLEDQITGNEREPTPSETAEIKTKCNLLREQCHIK